MDEENKENTNRESTLALLKHPLVFFGLAITVIEGAFGTGLALSTDSELLAIILSSWMGGLFLITISYVTFLVYKVPTHVMLESQKDLGREKAEIEILKDRLNQSYSGLKKLNIINNKD